jgi:hypothetical protein
MDRRYIDLIPVSYDEMSRTVGLPKADRPAPAGRPGIILSFYLFHNLVGVVSSPVADSMPCVLVCHSIPTT